MPLDGESPWAIVREPSTSSLLWLVTFSALALSFLTAPQTLTGWESNWPNAPQLRNDCCCCLVATSSPTLCNPVDSSTPGSSVLLCLPEFPQTYAYWVGDAIQPSHPLPPLSPCDFNLSRLQCLLQWISSSNLLAKVLELHLQHQFFQWISRVDFPSKYRIQKDTFLKASLWKMSFIWRVETVLKFVVLNPSLNFKNDQFIPNLVHLCLSNPLYNWVIHWVGQKFHSSFLQNVTEQTFWTSPVCLQCRRHRKLGSSPWFGNIPCRRASLPTPVILPMDRRTWWTIVHRVRKSWTRLKQQCTHACKPFGQPDISKR